MIRFRFSSFLFFGFVIVSSNAQWTAINLHPTGAFESRCTSANGAVQGGRILFTAALTHGGKWNGTAASWVDLHPSGKSISGVEGTGPGNQVGYANDSAVLWTGSASGWVNLTPASASYAEATCSSGSQQGGKVGLTGGFTYASLWNGSNTWVNLSPSFHHGAVNGISVSEQVGYVQAGNATSACLWNGTADSRVDLHPAGATNSQCIATSGATQVGYANYGLAGDHACKWSGSLASFTDLHPSGAESSYAGGVYSNIVVGWVQTNGTRHAGYWPGSASSFVDLHTFLPADFEGSEATAISSDASGLYIVGFGYNVTTSRYEALMWRQGVNQNFNLTLNKSSVAGQNSVLGTVTMEQAQITSTLITTYDNSGLVTTPPSVTIAANTLTKTFQITTAAITSTVNTSIFAKLGSVTKSQPLTLIPLIPTALSFTPTQVTGGQSTSCRVVINGVSGPGGRVIAMLDNSANATVPPTVTVPPGATSVTFPIPTTAVTSLKTVTVTARVSAGEKSGTFRIAP